MAIFKGNEQLDVLDITEQYNPGSITLDSIKLPNNTELVLNLEGVSVAPSDPTITNIDQITTLKIIINWGDGTSDTISPYFHILSSSINSEYKSWANVSHLYALKTEDSELSLEIYVYNSLNDCAILTIPVTIQFQSLLESCTKFQLVSANITNDNKVSYVLNNLVEKSNFVVSSVK